MTPAPTTHGCAADHDDLIAAYTAWRGAEGAFEATPRSGHAFVEQLAFADLRDAALVCGMSPPERDVIGWARRRIVSYSLLYGRGAEGRALVGGAV